MPCRYVGTMKPRLLAAVSLSAVAVATMAGCSSSGQGAIATASASQQTSVLTTASFPSVVGDAVGAARSAHVDMTITASGNTITADGDVSYGDATSGTVMAMTMNLPTMSNVDMKFVGGKIYIDLGAQTQNKYVAIDPANGSNAISKSFASIADSADPGKAFTLVKSAISSVTVAGAPVALDGVEATPYTVSLMTSGLLSALGLPTTATSTLPPQIDYTYWIGPDNLIRKETFTLAGTSEELDYSKWGEPVSVQAPDPGQITQMAGL